MQNNNYILSIKNLTKNFNDGWFWHQQNNSFIKDISFNLNYGESIAIFGPNGSGKTTLLNLLLDLITPSSGSINYFGQEFNSNKTNILKNIGFATINSKLPSKLTVKQNLDIHARLYDIDFKEREKRINQYLDYFDITNLKKAFASNLSSGQLAKVMLIKAFITNPKIVILDEPTASLDNETFSNVINFIKEEKTKKNISIILATHNIDEIAELCEKILLIKNGELQDIICCNASKSKEEIKQRLLNFYSPIK